MKIKHGVITRALNVHSAKGDLTDASLDRSGSAVGLKSLANKGQTDHLTHWSKLPGRRVNEMTEQSLPP